MKILEKLHMMKQIEEDNRKHVEDWKQRNMKLWVADYAFIDADGVKREWEIKPEFEGIKRSFTICVDAMDIQGALDEAKKTLLALAAEKNWQEVRIIDIGICNENIW